MKEIITKAKTIGLLLTSHCARSVVGQNVGFQGPGGIMTAVDLMAESDEEFTNYGCKYVSALKSKPSSAPELALQFWLLVATVAVQL